MSENEVASLLERHAALLERVTVLERAIEHHREFVSQIAKEEQVEQSVFDEELWAVLDA